MANEINFKFYKGLKGIKIVLVPCNIIILDKLNKTVKTDIFIDVISRDIHSIAITKQNLHIFFFFFFFCYTQGSHLSQIFWKHENLLSLSVIWLIYIKLSKEKNWQKIWAKQKSSLTTVQLKWDPPTQSSVYIEEILRV